MTDLSLRTHVFRCQFTRQLRKRAPLVGEGVGFTTIDDGHERADLIVEIDVGAIVQAMAEDAMRNKSKVSKEIGGAVRVKATNLRRV